MAHGVRASHLFAGWLCWIISITEGAVFILTRIEPYSKYGFVFLAQNTASKATICGFTENLFAVMILHMN